MNTIRVSSEPETIEYSTILFAQGEDSDELINLYDMSGPNAVADRATDWRPDAQTWSAECSLSPADRHYWTCQSRDGHSGVIVSINRQGLYVAVTEWREAKDAS